MSRRRTAFVTAWVLAGAARALAQPAGDPVRPAFSLASSHTFSTRERPVVSLSFRRVDHLDFRVYRVDDTATFFAGLRDLHQLGSPAPEVPQEPTLLERLANWKADRRDELRAFVRRQFSAAYRAVRRTSLDTEQVQLRRTSRYQSFAEVPLVNPSRLVSSWRELLPPVREAEARRIPLDLPGPGAYLVEAVHAPLKAYTVVIVSDLGLVMKTAPRQLVAYAANRFTGEPAPGCRIDTIANQKVMAAGATGADGTYELWLDEVPETFVTLASCDGQIAAADPGSWLVSEKRRDLVGYVYTDKPIYRPGHTVRIKAILRWRERGGLVPFDQARVEVSVIDSGDNVVRRETAGVDAYGSVHTTWTVPSTAALGYYSIRIATGDSEAQGSFEVQEYRKPEFEVTVTPTERVVVQGAIARARVTARYYFGQPVANAAVRYALYRSSYYSPLRWREDAEDETGWYGWAGDQIGEGTLRLDAAGMAELSVPLEVDRGGGDYALRIEARATDASGREVSGQSTVVGAYGRFLLTIDAGQYVLRPGEPVQIRVAALDYTGTPQPLVPLRLRLERLTYLPGASEPEVELVTQSTTQTDASGRATWALAGPDRPGHYRFRVSSSSLPAEEREIEAETFAWIAGRGEATGDADRVLELVADRREYQPGDTARLVVQGAEFDTAVLVTKEGQHVSYRHVQRRQAGELIDVPIGEEDVGDVWVSIAFLLNDRLHVAERRLRVPPASRAVRVTIEAAQAVARPRQAGTFTLRTTDQAGQPIQAQVSLAVIDEAVYGVAPDRTVDPVRFFYRREYSRVSTQFSREYSFVGYSGPDELRLAQKRRPFTLADFKGPSPDRPHVRKEFPDAIFWVADLVTDREGTATVKVTYPDALTTWRLTARAVTTDTRVGSTIARTTTTKDLIVRVVTPRFLTEGDEVTLPTIVHNYLAEPQTLTLWTAVDGLQPVGAGSPATQEITVAASGGELRLDTLYRAERVGLARVTGTATGGSEGDAVEVPIPVTPFGLLRQTGQSGAFLGAGERRLSLEIPEDSNPAARTIEMALAPSLGGSLLGALDYLIGYPYGCTEQTVSRLAPTLQAMRAFRELQITPPERLTVASRRVADAIRLLYSYQHEDGSWGWWATDQAHPFMTAYALYGLLEAKEAGVQVEDWRIGQGLTALARLYRDYPRAVPDLKAYIAYVVEKARARGNEPFAAEGYSQPEALNELWAAQGRMSAHGRALLLLALDAAGDARGETLATTLLAEARQQGDLAWWASDSDALLEDSIDASVEATALAVRALVGRQSNHPTIERAVRWMLASRSLGGYWVSTKQTAMALYGLLDYMRARGERPVPYTVDLFVNGERVGAPRFGPDAWTSPTPTTYTTSARAGANEITLVKTTAAPLYWTATARYHDPNQATIAEGTRKLALAREYFLLSPIRRDDRIVYRESPLTGSAKPGDLVLVRLTAAGSRDWQYLIVEDPLPAGVEPVRDEELYELERQGRWWWSGESRREYRDDRVVIFQRAFEEGRYEYRYLLKVILPGQYRANPARIMPMYEPGAFASTPAGRLTVSAPAPTGAER